MTSFLTRHYRSLLLLICVFAFVTRVYNLGFPKQYVFDEVYHAVTAKLVRENDPRAFEWWNPPPEPNTAVEWLHPPLAKYTQALGMDIFGENSFGWRISSVVFGVLVVLVTAFLAYELFGNKPIALLAALLASFDGLLLVQSRIAMNDIHVTLFILLTFLCYLRYRKRRTLFLFFLTGLCAGLAMASKWSGVFALGVVWLFELPTLKNIRTIPRHVLFLLFLPFTVYVLSYMQMFLQGKTLICEGNAVEQGACYCSQDSAWWVDILKKVSPATNFDQLTARGGCKQLLSHFNELHHQIWYYQTTLKATHPYQSRPMQWFFDLRPVWYFVQSTDGSVGNIYNIGNPLLFWLGDIAIFASIVRAVLLIIEKHHKKFMPFLFILVAYFAVWLPWQLSPRIMFFYHYTPAVPLLSILLAFWLRELWRQHYSFGKVPIAKIACFIAVAAIGSAFVVWYPNWTGMMVPKQFADSVYFALPSWR